MGVKNTCSYINEHVHAGIQVTTLQGWTEGRQQLVHCKG